MLESLNRASWQTKHVTWYLPWGTRPCQTKSRPWTETTCLQSRLLQRKRLSRGCLRTQSEINIYYLWSALNTTTSSSKQTPPFTVRQVRCLLIYIFRAHGYTFLYLTNYTEGCQVQEVEDVDQYYLHLLHDGVEGLKRSDVTLKRPDVAREARWQFIHVWEALGRRLSPV